MENQNNTSPNNDKKYISQLVNYTSNSYEFITRGNAMNALRKLNYIDETMVNNCIEACLSSNGRLAGPANETIKYFYAQTQFKKLISETIKKRNSKNWEKEILMKLIQ